MLRCAWSLLHGIVVLVLVRLGLDVGVVLLIVVAVILNALALEMLVCILPLAHAKGRLAAHVLRLAGLLLLYLSNLVLILVRLVVTRPMVGDALARHDVLGARVAVHGCSLRSMHGGHTLHPHLHV